MKTSNCKVDGAADSNYMDCHRARVVRPPIWLKRTFLWDLAEPHGGYKQGDCNHCGQSQRPRTRLDKHKTLCPRTQIIELKVSQVYLDNLDHPPSPSSDSMHWRAQGVRCDRTETGKIDEPTIRVGSLQVLQYGVDTLLLPFLYVVRHLPLPVPRLRVARCRGEPGGIVPCTSVSKKGTMKTPKLLFDRPSEDTAIITRCAEASQTHTLWNLRRESIGCTLVLP